MQKLDSEQLIQLCQKCKTLADRFLEIGERFWLQQDDDKEKIDTFIKKSHNTSTIFSYFGMFEQLFKDKIRHRVTAIIIKNKKLLLVEEDGVVYTPGGGIETGESHEEALKRECDEELGLTVTSWKPYSIFDSLTIRTKRPQRSYVYIVECEGDPHPMNEIEAFHWLSRDDIQTNPLVHLYEKENIFDRLIQEGLL